MIARVIAVLLLGPEPVVEQARYLLEARLVTVIAGCEEPDITALRRSPLAVPGVLPALPGTGY